MRPSRCFPLLPCVDHAHDNAIFLSIISAYEAGTTQNARSLGTSTVRHRRATVDVAPAPTPAAIRPLTALPKKQSSHALFFGTDDVASLKKKDGVAEEPDIEAIEKTEEKHTSKDWKEVRDLARDVFQVYFSLDDSGVDTSKMKKQENNRILIKINGTMPSLPTYLGKLKLPKAIVDVILFIEASFRGIAQV